MDKSVLHFVLCRRSLFLMIWDFFCLLCLRSNFCSSSLRFLFSQRVHQLVVALGSFVLTCALDPSAVAGWVLVCALPFSCLPPEVSRLWIHAASFEPLFLASILLTPGRAPVSNSYLPLTESGARVLCLGSGVKESTLLVQLGLLITFGFSLYTHL
jgi:hypothetical protein